MKKKYQVIQTTLSHFEGITFDYVIEDDSIGTVVNCLGSEYTIIQNGKVIGLVNKDSTMMLLDVTPEPEVIKPKFIINQNVEVFFETKTFEMYDIFGKFTYKEFFDFFQQEWTIIQTIKNIEFPLVWEEETKTLYFKDRWDIKGFDNLNEGCFVRLSEDGRQI